MRSVGSTFKRMWVIEWEERRVMTQEVAMGVEDPGTHDVGQVGLKTQWLKTQRLKTKNRF